MISAEGGFHMKIFILLLFISFNAQAQMDRMMGLLGPQKGVSRNSVEVNSEQNASNGSTSGLEEYGARASSAVIRDGKNTYSVNAAYNLLINHDTLTIPAWSEDFGFTVPKSMQSVSLGGGWDRELESGDGVGVTAAFGSDSDAPFRRLQDTTVNVTAFYHMPYGEHGTWHFFANYSNNRTFLNAIPIPGAIYSYVNPAKRLFWAAGFPLAFVSWGFTERWDLRASYIVPKTGSFEIGYKVLLPLTRVYVRIENQQKPYLRNDREYFTEQLFLQRARAGLGIQSPLSKAWSFDFETGYEFARSFHEEENREESAYAYMADDWFAKAQVTYRF
jgi:hypothetical protein